MAAVTAKVPVLVVRDESLEIAEPIHGLRGFQPLDAGRPDNVLVHIFLVVRANEISPRVVCEKPVLLGPTESPLLDVFLALTLEIASEPPRFRQDGSL